MEIYHHHKHDENIRDMQEGLKAALDYNTHYFGPYQHGEVRIVEFAYRRKLCFRHGQCHPLPLKLGSSLKTGT
ncbi:MAG: hypothetical protein IPN20_01490 [Haliscomenobacter sp.]|nr:hypothetical protein [Haliscomenobacter sp.]